MSTERNLTLYLAHRRKLVDYAGGILGDPGQAEDVVQEAFLRFRGSTTGRMIEEPVGFLYRIVRNLALDRRRRMKLEARYLHSDADGDASGIAADRPSPEQEVSDREALLRIKAAMERLPARTRQALEMHRFGGFTLKQIAAHFNISVSMAQVLVVEGIRHCQRAL